MDDYVRQNGTHFTSTDTPAPKDVVPFKIFENCDENLSLSIIWKVFPSSNGQLRDFDSEPIK